ncbi:hypothetical protein MY3957_002406 [Beauveria namnaoensis]
MFVLMRAQTDKARKDMADFGQYLRYRERDFGKCFLSAVMRFAMDLHLTADELLATRLVEENCSKHMSIVNDICSWERELRQSRSTTQEGARLCNGVQILSASLGLDVEATKACLWTMVREWEVKHERLCSVPFVPADISKGAMLYLKGLEYQMSGNELWSRTTPRYLVLD